MIRVCEKCKLWAMIPVIFAIASTTNSGFMAEVHALLFGIAQVSKSQGILGRSGCRRLCNAVVSHITNRYRRFRESLAFHTHASHWNLWSEQPLKRERERQRYRPFLFSFFLSFWFHPALIPQWANAFWCRQIGEHIKIHSTRRSLYVLM